LIWVLLATLAAAEPRSRFVDTGLSATATEPSWLVPEPYFDTCLVQGRELQIVYNALDRCTDKAVGGLTACDKRLTVAGSALATCEQRMVADAIELGEARARLVVLSEQNADLRRQRNRATLLATGVIIASSVAAGLSLAK